MEEGVEHPHPVEAVLQQLLELRPMIFSLFCRLEGPHDQLSHLSGLLSVNGENGASLGFLM